MGGIAMEPTRENFEVWLVSPRCHLCSLGWFGEMRALEKADASSHAVLLQQLLVLSFETFV